MLNSWRNPLVAVGLALFSYVLIQGYSSYHDHIEYVQGLEKDNKQLDEENGVLNESVGSLKLATTQQQQQVESLQKELTNREALLAEHEQKQQELEVTLSQLKEESRDAIESLTKELNKAGLRNIRLPDSVIRLQRERAKEINARANSRYKGSPDATSTSKAVSTVPST